MRAPPACREIRGGSTRCTHRRHRRLALVGTDGAGEQHRDRLADRAGHADPGRPRLTGSTSGHSRAVIPRVGRPASSLMMSSRPRRRADSCSRWNRTRSRDGGSAPSHRRRAGRCRPDRAPRRSPGSVRPGGPAPPPAGAASHRGRHTERSSSISPHTSGWSRPSKPHSSHCISTKARRLISSIGAQPQGSLLARSSPLGSPSSLLTSRERNSPGTAGRPRPATPLAPPVQEMEGPPAEPVSVTQSGGQPRRLVSSRRPLLGGSPVVGYAASRGPGWGGRPGPGYPRRLPRPPWLGAGAGRRSGERHAVAAAWFYPAGPGGRGGRRGWDRRAGRRALPDQAVPDADVVPRCAHARRVVHPLESRTWPSSRPASRRAGRPRPGRRPERCR